MSVPFAKLTGGIACIVSGEEQLFARRMRNPLISQV
ncbi:MAG: hypothetical protein ACJAUW_001262, partial [Yoonia sp.]